MLLSFGAVLGLSWPLFEPCSVRRRQPWLLILGFIFLVALADYNIFLITRIPEAVRP